MGLKTVNLGEIEQNTLLIDIATRNVLHLSPSDTVGEAAQIMSGKRFLLLWLQMKTATL